MTTRTLSSLLVGTRFATGAELILRSLPAGAQLILVPDAQNPYDPNAIQVLVDPSSIPQSQHEALAAELPGYGTSLEELLSSRRPMLLGHVAMAGGKPLSKAKERNPALGSNIDFLLILSATAAEARLGFSPEGQALVELHYHAAPGFAGAQP